MFAKETRHLSENCDLGKLRFGLLVALVLIFGLSNERIVAQEATWPSVGVAAKKNSVILPGSELEGQPLIDDAPMVVQVENVFVHNDSFRYDLRYQGFEPGDYDLTEWLMRKDGSSKAKPACCDGDRAFGPSDLDSKNPTRSKRVELPDVGGYQQFAIIIDDGLVCSAGWISFHWTFT